MPYDKDTSGDAWKKLNPDGKRRKVMGIIMKFQPINDKRIAKLLGWPINTVTPRRNELVKLGIVTCAKKAADRNTGITVNYWKIKR